MRLWFCLFTLFVLSIPGAVRAQESILRKGDRLAIIGDSITEQKLYSKYIETYLLACYPELEIQSFQFGWGGERAPGFAARMENDLVPWKPTVVTTCYGMNDGSYRAFEEQIGKNYEQGMRQIIDRMKKEGATVVVGSPGVVDTFTWARNNPDFDQVYNDNLKQLGAIAKKLADENGFPHADVFGEMMKSMVASKASLGEEYPVAGGDGVHPGANGHLLMAYAFLKAFGLEGDIGTLNVDLASGKAEASSGHKIVNDKDGSIEIESSRYPFCFSGDLKDPNGTASILPYTAFNQDLNRFMLRVANLNAPQADVTFGKTTKTFSKERLAVGINLADEFLDNPFVESFHRVMDEVAAKQAFETQMIKGFITNFRQLQGSLSDDPEVKTAIATLRRKMTEVNDQAHAKARAAVKPVRYSVVIKPKS
jgi:lysophospholipase L1-like esterase